MYPRWMSVIIHLTLIVANLLFYWYFTQVIEAKEKFKNTVGDNYFWYIIIGELSLGLSIKFLSKPPLILKQLYAKGILDEFLALKNVTIKYTVLVTFVQVILELSKFLILIALIFYSQNSMSLITLSSYIVLQLFFIPLFLGLGLIACHIVIYFGRGEKILQILVSILFIFAGAYFPLEVLPFDLKSLLMYSPLNVLVDNTRFLLNGGSLSSILGTYHFSILALGLFITGVTPSTFQFLVTKTNRPLSRKPYIYNM